MADRVDVRMTGLYRCCVQCAQEEGKGSAEGQTLRCRFCGTTLRWTRAAWELGTHETAEGRLNGRRIQDAGAAGLALVLVLVLALVGMLVNAAPTGASIPAVLP